MKKQAFFIFVLGITVASCGIQDEAEFDLVEDSLTVSVDYKVPFVVTKRGGTFEFPDGMRLQIPYPFLPSGEEVLLTLEKHDKIPEQLPSGSRASLFYMVHCAGPHGRLNACHFETEVPITAEVPLTAPRFSRLFLSYMWDDVTHEWKNEGMGVRDGNFVIIPVPHVKVSYGGDFGFTVSSW